MKRTLILAVAAGLSGCMGYASRNVFSAKEDSRGFSGQFRRESFGSTSTAKTPNVRIREYFPETLYWNPQVVTDEKGRAEIDVKMADSITTWRLTALANSRSGALGSTTKGLRVFRSFFVDIDFPVALTQHDSVKVPVAVYNYLKTPQKVLLEVEKEDWFELEDEAVKSVDLAAEEVKAVHFRVKVKKIGPQRLTVFAKADDSSDAVRRPVEIVPDGKMFEIVLNDRLARRIDKSFEIPKDAIEGSLKVFGKVYPGVFAQVIEGVEGMLGMPHG
ncbi:MAG: hypothetical protein HYY17_02955 [Planctomycetes bacterium]|nr:hypothetical protein [Planctomycetota bacterium]